MQVVFLRIYYSDHVLISELVMQVLRDEGRDWWSLLRQTQTDNQDNTPFREMIRKKPGMFQTYDT